MKIEKLNLESWNTKEVILLRNEIKELVKEYQELDTDVENYDDLAIDLRFKVESKLNEIAAWIEDDNSEYQFTHGMTFGESHGPYGTDYFAIGCKEVQQVWECNVHNGQDTSDSMSIAIEDEHLYYNHDCFEDSMNSRKEHIKQLEEMSR